MKHTRKFAKYRRYLRALSRTPRQKFLDGLIDYYVEVEKPSLADKESRVTPIIRFWFRRELL